MHRLRCGCLLTLTVVACIAAGHAREDARRTPNIVLIMADDLGFEALGCYGGESYRTPNLDKLAASGMRFDYAFCTPVCSPTRVEVMTGRYPFRTGWTSLIGRDGIPDVLDTKEKTFGHVLKSAGYATVVAGKWQLCTFADYPDHPVASGFDRYCLWAWDGGSRYWDPSIWQDGERLDGVGASYGPDVYCDYLIRFIRDHRDGPFFVYYPMTLVHAPFNPTPPQVSQGEKGLHAYQPRHFKFMVAYMDELVGRIVDALDDAGLRENTLILYTTDNGTHKKISSTWKGTTVTGGKNKLTDAGTRVPLIANWPGTVPAGTVQEDLIDFTDILPTLAELAGASLPQNVVIDGRSFAPQLLGQPGRRRDWVFSQLRHKYYVRDKRWKLYGHGKFYDMRNDPFERKDLADAADPAIIAARERLAEVIADLKRHGANLP